MQDTATQAMTEVALGLSMAFFALLILALISVSLPTEAELQSTSANKIDTEYVPSNKQITLNSNQTDAVFNDKKAANKAQKQTIILYWQGQFFDVNKQAFNPQSLSPQQAVIVAVSAQSNLQELLTIQEVFAQQDVKLTSLTKEWVMALNSGENAK